MGAHIAVAKVPSHLIAYVCRYTQLISLASYLLLSSTHVLVSVGIVKYYVVMNEMVNFPSSAFSPMVAICIHIVLRKMSEKPFLKCSDL